MEYKIPYNTNVRPAFEAIMGAVLLLCGCLIYLLFRSTQINLYKWCCIIGLSDVLHDIRERISTYEVSAFVQYSLPDGLYCVAYILLIDSLWQNNNKAIKNSLIILIPIIAICSEFFQYFGVINGTFDLNDLLCYIAALVFYYLFNILLS